MKTLRTNKGTNEKYLMILCDLKQRLDRNEKTSLADVVKKHKAGSSIPSILREMGVIRFTLNGNEWCGDQPSMKMVLKLREKIAIKHQKYNKPKQEQPKQLFEWQKPQPTVKIEPKYEYNVQPDSTAVSEFIDHHEQSLLPSPTKRVKTAKNDVKERVFQLRIFGINLFTVKY